MIIPFLPFNILSAVNQEQEQLALVLQHSDDCVYVYIFVTFYVNGCVNKKWSANRWIYVCRNIQVTSSSGKLGNALRSYRYIDR
jgi:hypothetical protein